MAGAKSVTLGAKSVYVRGHNCYVRGHNCYAKWGQKQPANPGGIRENRIQIKKAHTVHTVQTV